MEHLQYPVGKWSPKEITDSQEIKSLSKDILKYAAQYRNLTENLDNQELAKTYREGSWNIRQLVHHVADSHLFHYLRLKHALTEDKPVGVLGKINDWAEMADYTEGPIEDSLLMIESVHRRYVLLFESLSPEVYERSYFHPFRQLYVTIPQSLDMIVWHLRHHLAHIEIALKN
jgi:DinB superfamily